MRLLFLGVAGQLDDLHAVEQGRRDRVEHVRRGDEHDLREVESDVEVVVAEGRVLLGVEDFQKRRRRIAAEVRAELVDLVEHEDRVVRARLANALDDPAGHGADVGPAVAADLGLVVHAAQADADELAARAPWRCSCPATSCPRPAGPTKQRIGPFMSFFSLRTARYSRIRSLIFSRS